MNADEIRLEMSQLSMGSLPPFVPSFFKNQRIKLENIQHRRRESIGIFFFFFEKSQRLNPEGIQLRNTRQAFNNN